MKRQIFKLNEITEFTLSKQSKRNCSVGNLRSSTCLHIACSGDAAPVFLTNRSARLGKFSFPKKLISSSNSKFPET